MDKTTIAEWVLSLVLPPDRAAATAGDFAEGAIARGGIWFWSGLFRILLSRIWSDLAVSPGSMVMLALRAWAFYIWSYLWRFALMILMITITLLVTSLIPQNSLSAHSGELGSLLGLLTGCALSARCDYKTGQWIAHRAPGREMTALVALCLVPFFLAPVDFVIMQIWGTELEHFISTHQNNSDTSSLFLAYRVIFYPALFAGALQVRRKAYRTTTS